MTNFNDYIKYAITTTRLPIDLRTNKKLAKEYLSFLTQEKINITNKDVLVLASWTGVDVGDFKSHDTHSTIKEINHLRNDLVADFTVPEGHSYVANGIVVHNCNLPNNVSKELVSQVYMRAWEVGCKGFTVYRDGCRTGVLVSNETYAQQKKTDAKGRPLKITPVMSPKRPTELSCDIHHVTVKGVKWTALVGLLHNEPYELFMGKTEDVPVSVKHKHGKIIKAGRGQYNLYLPEGDRPLIENIVKTLDDNEIAWATRMISTSLRHGIGVEYLVEQLSKEGSVVDVNNVLARILKKYLKEAKKDTCPTCYQPSVIYEEKCKRCTSCGWTAC